MLDNALLPNCKVL